MEHVNDRWSRTVAQQSLVGVRFDFLVAICGERCTVSVVAGTVFGDCHERFRYVALKVKGGPGDDGARRGRRLYLPRVAGNVGPPFRDVRL